MSNRSVLVVDLAIAAVLVIVALLLSPGPAALLIGAVIVLLAAALGWGIGRLRKRRRAARSGLRRRPRRVDRPQR
jgi:hypothetical protein